MINTILCFFIGHKVQHNGNFHIVEFGRINWRTTKRFNVFRCYRCGCEVKRETTR